MARRVFNLHDVDADEAADIVALLEAEGIVFYRTEANPWGFSTAALWVSKDSDHAPARAIIERYQDQRRQRRDLLPDADDTFRSRARQSPLRVLTYLAVAIGILLLSLLPFVNWALAD